VSAGARIVRGDSCVIARFVRIRGARKRHKYQQHAAWRTHESQRPHDTPWTLCLRCMTRLTASVAAAW
jgi:hypothetical protein